MSVWKRISSLLFAGWATAALFAQSPNAPPTPAPVKTASIPLGANGKPLAFDIVSFRRTETHGSSRIEIPDNGDSIAYHGQPVERMIYFAYLTMGPKVVDAPDWVSNDLYDFQAKVAAEDVEIWQKMDLQAKRLMVRAVLEDALKLRLHPNDRTEPVYDLVVSGKSKLKEYVDGETKTLPNGDVLKGTSFYGQNGFDIYFQGYTMQNLADTLVAHHITDKDVINKTGLNAKYDFTLTAIPYSMPQEMVDRMGGGGPVQSEIQKIGLKLVPGKAISPGVIIEHIERPPEN